MPKSMTSLSCSEMRAAGNGVEAQFQLPVAVDDFMQRSHPTNQLFNRHSFQSSNFHAAQDESKEPLLRRRKSERTKPLPPSKRLWVEAQRVLKEWVQDIADKKRIKLRLCNLKECENQIQTLDSPCANIRMEIGWPHGCHLFIPMISPTRQRSVSLKPMSLVGQLLMIWTIFSLDDDTTSTFQSIRDGETVVSTGDFLSPKISFVDHEDDTKINSESNAKKMRIIISTTILSTGLLILGLALLFYVWKKQHQKGGKLGRNQKEDLELPLFDLMTIVSATSNFSIENKLGEGGFGSVFKGTMENGQEIAVKRLSKSSRQGLDEFKNEVTHIAKLQHRNLVKLLGCCIQEDEMILIYEFMPNKSLDFFIFDMPLKLIDASVEDSVTLHEVVRTIHVGLLCVQRNPGDRPSMSAVVLMLGGEGALPPPLKPSFYSERDLTELEVSHSSKACSANEVTISLVEAR
ncbi:hypothetical protein DVH24_010816 [Malus domestica]|uniref:non-specific serine/threonine protein kinase n=1 Tax=Malus domestica TaxID=3750 RepID=A0A498JZ83_MALDO|nr:hypothetical protein DVH24_010816 [Malus domestica]